MNRSIHAFIAFTVFLSLVACSPNPAPATEVIVEEPAVSLPDPTLIPTLTPTEPPEPTQTPEPTPEPEPTPTPTPVTPTPEPEPTQWDPPRPEQECEPSDSTTCSILYILTDEYDDEHILKTQSHFERAGYTAYVASNTLEVVRGFHECYDFTPAYPDLLLEEVDVSDYDAIFFVGSDGNTTDLHTDPAAHRVAEDAMESGKVVVAVGDGPVILAKAGLLEGKTVNVINDEWMYGVTDQWFKAVQRYGGIYTERSPVRDGMLITADFATYRLVWGVIEMMQEQVEGG